MTVSGTLRPGSSLGVYPQRLDGPADNFERSGRAWLLRLSEAVTRPRYRLPFVASRVERAGVGLQALEDEALLACVQDLREALLAEGLTDRRVFQSLAVLREFAARRLAMRPYDVQLFGAWVIVRGQMAEMATGEGKSLTAFLAAATVAMAGVPVHVITTNEYLARRDAEELRPVYESLGLTVTAVVEAMTTDEKRRAYHCDIVYCTNKQVAFDYLRDRLLSRNATGPLSLKFSEAYMDQRLTLRGLCFAIVDEADSVLIDEARTPLLLSREHRDLAQEQIYAEAVDIARAMQADKHFRIDERERRITLTDSGVSWLEDRLEGRDGIWSGARHARYLVHQALCALHQFERDTHYLVRDDRVVIIDRNTGRAMADRSWQQGLHQMIECKEGCPPTGQRETLASISYQRFFRRYLHLGGLSGTLGQVRGELRRTYHKRLVRVPTHRPCRRIDTGFKLHLRATDKWLAVLQEVERVHAQGRPVLVGTQTVSDSRLLGAFLTRRRLPHRVLNAQQDHREAHIVARAGMAGRITIATNMAGRGTDIKLGEGVVELGGLHVIATDCHEEYRVDRQLYGRCARQGDPGSLSTHVSLADPLLRSYPSWVRRAIGATMRDGRTPGERVSRAIVRLAQYLGSARNRAERRDVMRREESLGRMLGYTGRQE